QRRIYTDDSDPLCAAVHAGFVRWSALGRARKEGRDVRVEVRVVRVLGAAGKGELGKEGSGAGENGGYREGGGWW
ncbi:hypothetical protein B0H14DRAFT_2341222, partial [Mycena olivaceomarginata]